MESFFFQLIEHKTAGNQYFIPLFLPNRREKKRCGKRGKSIIDIRRNEGKGVSLKKEPIIPSIVTSVEVRATAYTITPRNIPRRHPVKQKSRLLLHLPSRSSKVSLFFSVDHDESANLPKISIPLEKRKENRGGFFLRQ